MKRNLTAVLEKIAELKGLPKEGVGSVYLSNKPQHGGYAVWEVENESGGIKPWNSRLKPQEMLMFLISLLYVELDKKEAQSA